MPDARSVPPAEGETAPDTRRGLPVKRPKGKPFTYTVEQGKTHRGGLTLEVRIKVDGYWSDATVRVESHPDWGSSETRPAEVDYSGGGQDRTVDALSTVENFAAALRWAVQYARRWNARHGLGQEGEAGGG